MMTSELKWKALKVHLSTLSDVNYEPNEAQHVSLDQDAGFWGLPDMLNQSPRNTKPSEIKPWLRLIIVNFINIYCSNDGAQRMYRKLQLHPSS